MATLKKLGARGQITLGKEFAGKQVLVDQVEPGAWVIKVGQFIRDNERWLHQPETAQKLDRAIAWAESNPPTATDFDELETRQHS